jgi:O-antigen ligase
MGYPRRGDYELRRGLAILGVANTAGALLFLDPRAVEGGRRSTLVLYGSVVALAAGLVFLLSVRQRRSTHSPGLSHRGSLDFLVKFSVVVGAYGLMVGVIRANSYDFLLGDAYDYVLFGLVYFSIISMRPVSAEGYDFTWILRWAVAMGLLVQIRDLWIGYAAIGDGRFRVNSILWMHNLVAAIAAVLLAFTATYAKERRRALIALFILVGTASFSAFRAYYGFLIVAIIVAVAIAAAPQLSKAVRFLPGFLLFMVCLGMAVGLSPAAPVLERSAATMVERLSSLGEQDVSVGGRFVEWESITLSMSAEPSLYVTGAGLGGQYLLSREASDYARSLTNDAGEKHHVHFLAAALLFRHGLLGLVFYLFLLVTPVVIARRNYRSSGDVGDLFVVLVLVMYGLNGLIFGQVQGDILFGIAVGITGYRSTWISRDEKVMVGLVCPPQIRAPRS